MVKITFVEHDGHETVVETEAGPSLMKAAVAGGVPGVSADCGGSCACGTCRIYLPIEWRERIPAPRQSEQEMIDYSEDSRPGVRLSCQIAVTQELDGLVLKLPESQ